MIIYLSYILIIIMVIISYKIDAVTISSRIIPNSWGFDQRQLGV
jgi:hypothetical protein